MGVLVEVCCGGIDDLLTAQRCGGDRAEFCAGLPLGGLTPSMGCFAYAREQVEIPLMVMVRPRGSGFCYSDDEFTVMLRDARMFTHQGADGIVFGCLTPQGQVDRERCLRMREAAGDAALVFHRAFDVTPQPLDALEQLIEVGVDRILTSGQQPTAPLGAGLLAKLVQAAAGRIEILGGAGVRPENLTRLVAQTGLKQVHLAAASDSIDPSTDHNQAIRFGMEPGYDNRVRVTDPQKLAAAIRAAKAIV